MFSPCVEVALVFLFLEKLILLHLEFTSLRYAFYGCIMFGKREKSLVGPAGTRAYSTGPLPAVVLKPVCHSGISPIVGPELPAGPSPSQSVSCPAPTAQLWAAPAPPSQAAAAPRTGLPPGRPSIGLACPHAPARLALALLPRVDLQPQDRWTPARACCARLLR
jgi:hypothetical protein